MAGVAVEKSEKTVNNTFTAIRFKTEEEAGAREIDGDKIDPVRIDSPSEAIKTNVKFM